MTERRCASSIACCGPAAGIVMTPIHVDVTDEDPTITDPKERLRRFGQDDHVRRYGWDYVTRLEEHGLSVEVVKDYPPNERIRRHQLNNREGFVEPLFLIGRR